MAGGSDGGEDDHVHPIVGKDIGHLRCRLANQAQGGGDGALERQVPRSYLTDLSSLLQAPQAFQWESQVPVRLHPTPVPGAAGVRAHKGVERGVHRNNPVRVISSLHLLEGGIFGLVESCGRDGRNPAPRQGRALSLPRKRLDPPKPIAVVPEAVFEGEI
jgi:hypothetical protein